MLKISLFIVVSQDGLIADAQGQVDALVSVNQGEDYGYAAFYQSVDGLIMGSNTYQRIINNTVEWPYADKPSYVFTQQFLLTPKSNVILINKDIKDFISEFEQSTLRQHLWLVGGAKLITAFYNQDLIQQYIITIIPKQLGKGIALPKVIWERQRMKKIETKHYYDGVVQHYLISI